MLTDVKHASDFNSIFMHVLPIQCLFQNDISYSAWSWAALTFKCSGSQFSLWIEESLGICKHGGLGRTCGSSAHHEAWVHLTTRKSGWKCTLPPPRAAEREVDEGAKESQRAGPSSRGLVGECRSGVLGRERSPVAGCQQALLGKHFQSIKELSSERI